MWLFTYDPNSSGAKLLAETLKVKRIRYEGSKFVGGPNKTVINWGASKDYNPEILKCKIINHPDKIAIATNKLEFFKTMSQLADPPRLPPWTSSIDTAVGWLDEGHLVVCRLNLNASGGHGLHICDAIGNLYNCHLYTQYIPKKDEYRVHFVNGKIIDFQRKALRPDVDKNSVDWKVRNLDNGFIFVREGVELPTDVTVQAEKTIKGLNLDFGAIDIIYNKKQNAAYVLEVNTAPGLVGKTLESYAKAFEQYRTTKDNEETE